MKHARSLVWRVCNIAGQVTCIDDLRHDAVAGGLVAAVEAHDTPVIFDWLMHELSHQGISDAVADGYIDRHGNVTCADIERSLASNPGCYKLQGYWAFTDCRYHKGFQTCAAPDEFGDCPLPRHRLRNGRLNQTAYSLFLFIRDIAGGDIVGWIDQQLADQPGATNLAAARAALIDPLRRYKRVRLATIKLSEAIFQCYASQQQDSGSKPSTRPLFSHAQNPFCIF